MNQYLLQGILDVLLRTGKPDPVIKPVIPITTPAPTVPVAPKPIPKHSEPSEPAPASSLPSIPKSY